MGRRLLLLGALLGVVIVACETANRGYLGDGGAGDAQVACAKGQSRCGDACSDLVSDVTNCGACGVTCGPDTLCCAGACNATASCSLSLEQPAPATGWQNGGGYLTLRGQGFSAGMKAFIGDGRAPLRFIDSTSARIVLPPGPLGPQDIKIVVAGASAVLPKGFAYTSGQLGSPWQQKPMKRVRGEDPGVAVMQDGRVLVAGGTLVPDKPDMATNTVEIYTRESDTVTQPAALMSSPRWQNSAVTLLDGRVLIVGGACGLALGDCNGNPRSADLFDPLTETLRPTVGPLNVPRAYTRAVLLGDGRVLVASGNDASLEVYDPDKDTFTVVPGKAKHIFGFLVRLRDGRALLGGGDGGVTAAEIFDPDTNALVPAGALAQARSMLSAHTLPDGRVLIIGGSSMSAGAVKEPLDTVETWDPATGAFALLPLKMSQPRTWHASALVRDGTILVMGGYTLSGHCDSLTNTVDQIDPVNGTVKPFAILLNANTEWNAVTLLDGSVLGVGGGACGTSMALPDLDFLPGGPG